MNKLLNIGKIITVVAMFYVTYYLLLQENCFNASISSIIDKSHKLEHIKHLIVLGLLPIYIATMVFGSTMLGLYLGSKLQVLLARLLHHKTANPKKQQIEKLTIFSVRK